MSLGKVSVLGGQIEYPFLTNKLPDVEYAKAKAQVWMYMLNESRLPKRWLKANSKGTKINFDMISSQADYDKGLIDLECFLKEINEQFGFDFKLTREGNK